MSSLHEQSATGELLSDTYDLDFDPTFETAFQRVSVRTTSNFAVHFNATTAKCAIDLEERHFKSWLKSHDATQGTRWIHIWAGNAQRPLLEHLAQTYDISPRLLSFLNPVSKRNRPSSNNKDQPESTRSSPGIGNRNDVEKEAAFHVIANDLHESANLSLENMGVTDIVRNLWHFSTVDWGHRYLYVGFNVLSPVPQTTRQMNDKPAGQRLWTSLVICDDGTVISTSERPPTAGGHDHETACFKAASRHICNVFRHLSRAELSHSKKSNDMMVINIRPSVGKPRFGHEDTQEQTTADTSSLLFYYLFDDWMTTFALIARIEHPYRKNLEQIRHEMTISPDVALLEKLHSVGQQLTVLQLVYKSYAQIIARLLSRHDSMQSGPLSIRAATQMHSDLGHSTQDAAYPNIARQSTSPWSRRSSNPVRPGSTATPKASVLLQPMTITKFERLQDRIHLYALAEIAQCLTERDSLVFMAFNLLTLSESHAVEKLTRTTIVLAKMTIFFLPVSLLTAYFSIQVKDIENTYTLKTYWISFAIVSTVSLLFLLVWSLKPQIKVHVAERTKQALGLWKTRHR